MSFFAQMKHYSPEWESYIDHEFVRQLADGSLPKACFKHYLQQDYAFLIQFTRAWALALYKSRNLEEMRDAQADINAMLDLEIGLHIDYCQQWGISEADLAKIKESPACVAYTRYVLDCGMTGGLADLYAALLPCIYGYAEIGQRLSHLASVDSDPEAEPIAAGAGDKGAVTQAAAHETAKTTASRDVKAGSPANASPDRESEAQIGKQTAANLALDTAETIAMDVMTESTADLEVGAVGCELSQAHPYQAWINMYASDEYQAAATAAKTKFNWLCKEVSASKLEQLQHIFRTATRMEVAFWQMGLDLS